MRVHNESLWCFATSMATCLSAGLPLSRALEVSAGKSVEPRLRRAAQEAARNCEKGVPLSESLARSGSIFPHYFLPVLRAGEFSGRLAEAFQLVQEHSRRVAPSVRLVRNTWLYPVVCVGFGWVIRIGLLLYFGKHAAAVNFFWASFGSAALLGSLGWLLYRMEPVRRVFDLLLLQIPLLRETELRMAVVLFFATFRLAYEAGGLSVLNMFDLALDTVRNQAIRHDLLKAREVLRRNEGFGEAFETVDLLEDSIKSSIATGSIAGKLDRSMAQIVEKATVELDVSLKAFNNIFQRIVTLTVGMSIVETVFLCIM